MSGASPSRRRVRPSLAWLAIRTTALLLAVLVLVHFGVTHLVNDVAATDSAFVAERWQSGLVAATDWLMLVSAVVHGAAGVWVMSDEYVRSAQRRRALRGLVVVMAVLMVVGGTVTLAVVLGR